MIKKFFLPILLLSFITGISTAYACETGYIEYNGSCYKQLACKNGGTQQADKCKCKAGWEGNLCQTAKTCSYNATSCSTGYVVSETCQSGNNKYVKCKANPCSGYNYTTCPTGYAQSASCMSGKTKKLKCGNCASGYVKDNGKCYKKLLCKNGGTQQADKCKCKAGWTGDLCQTAKKCSYTTTKCTTGYTETGKTCQSGNNKYVECKANECKGYNYTKCPTGYAQSASCMSGKTKKLKCGNCAGGYVKYEGKCYKKLGCKNGGTQQADKCKCKAGWKGNLCQTAKTCSYTTKECGTGYTATGKTCQSGNNKYVECKANECSGYDYTKCPTGYKQSASCMSGTTKKLKCNSCANGYVKYNGKCYKKLDCKNGSTQKGNKCSCADGWEGNLCQTAKTCSYKTTKCNTGYVVEETCMSGNNKYVKCKANPCSGYNYTTCPTGYSESANCMSGKTKKLKCGNCASGYIKDSGKCYKKLDCKNGGTQKADKCSCKTGWTGNLCQTAASCSYTTTSCTSGYEETGKTCQSGNTTYKECKAKAVPSGYTKDKCGEGYKQVATFLSGTTTYYKCEANDCSAYQTECGEGYDKAQSCLSGTTPYYTCTPKEVPAGYTTSKCGEGYTQKDTMISGTTTYFLCKENTCEGYVVSCPKDYYATSDICMSGKTKMYKCKTDYTDFDNGLPIIKKELNSDNETVTVTVTYNDDGEQKNVIVNNENINVVTNSENAITGVYSEYNRATNAFANDGMKNSTIKIEQRGNGDIYGLRINSASEISELYNALGTENGTVSSKIEIVNNRANVYGMYSDSDINKENHATNVWANGHSIAEGIIDIINMSCASCSRVSYGINSEIAGNVIVKENGQGSGIIKIIDDNRKGNVYGISGTTYSFNALAIGNNATAQGILNISKRGKGNVYGIVGKNIENALTQNEEENQNHEVGVVNAIGIIDIINKGSGNSYGMYSDIPNNKIKNYSSNYTKSTIKIINVGDGEVTGIYSENGVIENSGDIIIHNLGNGNAYGINAVSANIENSGLINVNRENYIDGITYNILSELNEYNVTGILGASNSSATNLKEGIIKVSGGHFVRGIDATSSDAVNLGTIVAYGGQSISGISTFLANAQNQGVIYINSDKSFAAGLISHVEPDANTLNNANIINIVNQNNSKAYGIYAHGIAKNSGDITIHNIGEGEAFGIYGDGYGYGYNSIIENSGNITITRTPYTYNNLTEEDTTDDITYSANVAIGGTAYGIYGASGSSIIKTGTINIDGAETAYGVYAESGVTISEGEYIKIKHTGDGNIVGFENHNSGFSGIIEITNEGNGNVTGYNGDITEARTGKVIIQNKGDGVIKDGSPLRESVINNEGNGSVSAHASNILINNNGETEISAVGNIAEIHNEGNSRISANASNVLIYNQGNTGISTSGNMAEIHNEGNGSINSTSENVLIYNDGEIDAMIGGSVSEIHNKSNANINISSASELNNKSGINIYSNDTIKIYNEGNGNIINKYPVGRMIIQNIGNGNVVGGMRRSNDEVISIDNNGTGTVYGIYYNSDENYTKIKNETHINIISKNTSNVYGFYNGYADSQNSDGAIIEITNVGDGVAVGMYAKDKKIENYGDIKIHNLGDGTAVGIYADGTATVYNSGRIIIDRENFTDNITNSGNSITYSANTERGGKAIGIYGAINSFIRNGDGRFLVNKGTIIINGAQVAYGIYSEGDNVVNTSDGTIRIDGKYTENAIRLNGGQLFQDGVMTVSSILMCGHGRQEGDSCICQEGWSETDCDTPNTCVGFDYVDECPEGYQFIDTCQSGDTTKYKCKKIILKDEPLIGSDNIVNNDTVTLENNVYRDVYGMKNYDEFIINATADSSSISINNSENGDIYGIYTDEGEAYNLRPYDSHGNKIEAHASIDITSTGSGKVYGISGNNVYNLYAASDVLTDNLSANITIHNTAIDSSGIYGLKGHNMYNLYSSGYNSISTATIDITNYGLASILGIGDFTGNNNSGNAFISLEDNQNEFVRNETEAKLIIKNSGDGYVGGIVGGDGADSVGDNGGGEAYNLRVENLYGNNINASALIDITNYGDAEVQSMHGNNVYNLCTSNDIGTNSKLSSTIRIRNYGVGSVYGMLGYAGVHNNHSNIGMAKIVIENHGSGNAYGMSGWKIYNNSEGNASSVIEIANIGDGLAVGIDGHYNSVENSGDIKIHNLGKGTAVGIVGNGYEYDGYEYHDEILTITNSGSITIDREDYTDDMGTIEEADDITYTATTNEGGKAIGIYGNAYTNINNNGTITINGAEKAYGIWSEGGSVTNTGTIKINTTECSGANCSQMPNAIILNGGTLFQYGLLIADADWDKTDVSESNMSLQASPKRQAASLNLNDFGGTVVASGTSQFIVEGAMSGDLALNNSIIENGFDTTYSVKDMIQAGDTSGLHLSSQSALFDATLENDSDAVMTMKSFNDVVENQSLADFLKQNYANGNNEELFGLLKNKETLAALNDALDSLTSSDMFNRFTFEDLTMLRDLNADMNNTLFANNKDHLEVAGDIAPWNFDGNTGSNARYALYNTTFGRKSLGLGIAFSDIHSNNGRNDKDSRYDQTFQMSMPMGYKAKGFKFITTPRFGYAYGTYDRTGYEGNNYDGKVEKRMFGLMNEARYPISFGKWSIAPAVEFNALGYHIKGREDAKEYSLNIKSQNNYSVESGVGLYANRELKPTKNSTLKLNAGMAVYHEFADPYELELGMNGMDGSFRVRDDRRKDNRAVLRTGFDYGLGDNITLIGSFATYIDGTTHNNANLDFRYSF